MKKRLFEVLDEMNVEDTENNTQLVTVGSNFISADKVKGGAKISMGVPESELFDLMAGKKMPILLMVDKEKYFKRMNTQN